MAPSREAKRPTRWLDDETQEYHLLLSKAASPGRTRSVARKSLQSSFPNSSQGTARRPRPAERRSAASRDEIIIIEDEEASRSFKSRVRGQRAASLKGRADPSSFSDDVLYIQPRGKDSMFAWEHVGLGLEYNVSSGTTSDEYEPSTMTGYQSKKSSPVAHSDLEAVANVASNPNLVSGTASSPGADSSKPPRDVGDGFIAPQPDRVWVRNLIELRRDILRRRGGNHDLARRPESRQWLREQHRALEEGAILVTLKSVLAASGVSKLFTACAVDFMRPEYTSRYWKWSQSFVRLIDHTIINGDVDLLRRPLNAPPSLIKFVRSSVAQRAEGRLSPHKEALLTALGICWSDRSSQSQGSSDSDSSSQGMRLRKYSKRRRVQSSDGSDINSVGSKSVQPVLSEIFVPPDRQTVEKWARQFVELRRYFRPGRGYEIPNSMPYLRIWMNAEAARSSTGTLSVECCGVLRAARIIDAANTVRVPPDCYQWCRGFVDFVDYIIFTKSKSIGRSSRPPSIRLAKYIADCFNKKCDRLLGIIQDGLLSGVQPNWLNSPVVREFMKRQKTELSNLQKISMKKNLTGIEGISERPPIVEQGRGHKRRYEELESDIGNGVELVEINDDAAFERSQKVRNSNKCDRMVSSMIKGMVAESTGGRSRTTDEVDAEVWVENAGLEALNNYAQNWFRSFDE